MGDFTPEIPRGQNGACLDGDPLILATVIIGGWKYFCVSGLLATSLIAEQHLECLFTVRPRNQMWLLVYEGINFRWHLLCSRR